MTAPAGVVLAAGSGTRLRPLTLYRPKALCPVGGRLLVDRALDRLAPFAGEGPANLAVNAHHLADQVERHCRARAHVSLEQPQALGTAGALGALRDWIDGRAVLLTNADAYLPGGLARLVEGWDGERCRLLCRRVAAGERTDFTDPDAGALGYVGACLLPAAAVAGLPTSPSGLYEVLWRREHEAGRLSFAVLAPDEVAIDCGTPKDYVRADLHARALTAGPGLPWASA